MTSDDATHAQNDPATATAIAALAAPVWTAERIRALGPITDLATAATILRIGRALAYQMARAGTFPVPTIRVGVRYRVPVAVTTTDRWRVEPPYPGTSAQLPAIVGGVCQV